jgi:Na+/H+ antiporter NhaD/arsenite permease-like protein
VDVSVFPEDEQELIVGPLSQIIFGVVAFFITPPAFITIFLRIEMVLIITIVFIIGYMLIAIEHNIKIDKAAIALVTAVLCWLFIYLGQDSHVESERLLIGHLGDISAILFFLLGAMTIVEVVDSYDGFRIITDAVQTRSKPKILVLIAFITFFLSAILDNLTTSIVMTSLTGKLLYDRQERLWFASMIIIAANAGGAWSPIGDVTTTMLWIGGQITAGDIVIKTLIPSLMVVIVPLGILLIKFRGQKIGQGGCSQRADHPAESNLILFSGIGLLVSVPVFKTVTHMPPFTGMLIALGIMWIIGSLVHHGKEHQECARFSVANALQRVDTPSILFFLGILLAVSALQVIGVLGQIADFTAGHIENIYITGAILGLFSAVIDNVPLVAAAQGMFSMAVYPVNHPFWEFLALSAGTGGSALIIGSAAGVAVMGIEKINFLWYLKNVSVLALLGFFSGLGTFIFQQWIFS